jgi:hypothetical protein
MGNYARSALKGFICPCRGCDKKNNRRFTLIGLCMHLKSNHPGELEKRLKLKNEWRNKK